MQAARADCADGDARIPELDARIAELEKTHKKAWQAACGANTGARYVFRRGFVEKLSLDAKDLLANARKIFAAEPIEDLTIWKIWELPDGTGTRARLAPLLALPLHRIKRLSLAGTLFRPDDVAAVAEATTLGAVEILELSSDSSYLQPFAPLAWATSLPRLRELRIARCFVGDAGMIELASSRTLRLSRLVAPANGLGFAACAAIANATWAPLLEHLDLSANPIGDDGLRALAESRTLVALKTLHLDPVELTAQAADIILASEVFARLDLLAVATGLSVEDHARVRAKLGDRLPAKQPLPALATS